MVVDARGDLRRNTIMLLETFWQDLRYGLPVLRRNPAFAAVAVLSLALGTAANTAIPASARRAS
jgi:putative ABC transport system permease protein